MAVDKKSWNSNTLYRIQTGLMEKILEFKDFSGRKSKIPTPLALLQNTHTHTPNPTHTHTHTHTKKLEFHGVMSKKILEF